ncbi:MAG: 50S ribosomal protein L24 [Deltaproteobacteria bacterium]|jgi:large subunit ribosomal protein L24|nr:50S ribosomal protein L24 [Deltaproteobacteria bacterium]
MAKSIYGRANRYPNPDGEKICRFRKGDRLQKMVGKDLRQVGTLKEILTKKRMVLVEGINMVTRHTKSVPGSQEPGGRIRREAPVHVSNVALVCPKCMKPTRVGFEFLPPQGPDDKRKKVRVCKRCKAHIDD